MTDHTPRATKAGFDPARLLASPRFAQWLLGFMGWLALVLLLPLVLNGPGAGEAARRFASTSLPFLAVYGLLAGSLLVCMIGRVNGVRRRVSANPRPRLSVGSNSVVAPSDFDAAKATRTLRRAGYRHVATGTSWVWGVKYRWSPIGTLVLHSSVLLALLGAALAVTPGVDRMTHVSALQGVPVTATDGVPALRLESLEAVPGEQGTLLRLSGVVRTAAGRAVRVRPDLPALVNPITAVVVEDYDLAPTFSVVPTSAPFPITREAKPLRLRKRGSVDRMILDAGRLGTYRITVRLVEAHPGAVIATTERRGTRGAWRLIDSERRLGPGGVARIGKIRLRFEGLSQYAVLRVHRAPSGSIIGLALLMAVLGAGLRLLTPRNEATIASVADSTVVTVAVDAYKGSRSAAARLALAFEETT